MRSVAVVSRRVVALALLLAVGVAVPGSARWMFSTQEVPTDRLIGNATRYIEAHPEDPMGYYVRGRLHSMAFANGGKTLEVSDLPAQIGGDEGLTAFLPWESILVEPRSRDVSPERLEHLRRSVRDYRRSVALIPRAGGLAPAPARFPMRGRRMMMMGRFRAVPEALPLLGLGWMLEEGSKFADRLGVPPDEPLPRIPTESESSRFRQLIERLGSNRAKERDAAEAELHDDLPKAIAELVAARDHKDPEVRDRVGRLLAEFAPDGGKPPVPSPDEVKRFRALVARLTGNDARAWAPARKELERDVLAALPLLDEARAAADPRVRKRLDPLLVRAWEEKALAAYRRAYAATVKEERGMNFDPMANALISVDAGRSILRILKRRTPTERETREMEEIQKEIDQPRGQLITPLVFSLEGRRPLEDLLAKDARVRFDLDGTGRGAAWPWVRPDTALLVWDPNHRGKITSGRQLFGSVTWWIFWEHAYQPLALLDDDGDGWLAGRELAGLAVWRDRDGDGVSDPGEVVAIEQTGILRLAAHAGGTRKGVPWNPDGLRLRDGTSLPTYDWTPRSLTDK